MASPSLAIFLINPPGMEARLSKLENAYVANVWQTSKPDDFDDESEEAFWSQALESFSVYLDFVAYCLKKQLTPHFIFVDNEDVANTYALGYLVLRGYNEREAISILIRDNPRLEFNYYLACLLDQLLVRQNRLLEVVTDYETTGIVVSPAGVTYTKES